jgi:hypothetical protein
MSNVRPIFVRMPDALTSGPYTLPPSTSTSVEVFAKTWKYSFAGAGVDLTEFRLDPATLPFTLGFVCVASVLTEPLVNDGFTARSPPRSRPMKSSGVRPRLIGP